MTGPDGVPDGPHHSLRHGDATIAYRHTPARADARAPGVVFCCGFMSDMSGSKATTLEDWARRTGHGFTRFDYQGHGLSSGRFEEGTIGLWSADALAVLDRVTHGPQVLVGSSMGGWIALLLALARPERVAGLVTVAAAPDLTEDLMWAQFDADIRRQIMEAGVWHRPNGYGPEPQPITRALIEDGRRHLLLRAPIVFDGPVRLLHGMEDADVPWQTSLAIADRLTSRDVQVTLVKDGDHRLSREQDLGLLLRATEEAMSAATTSRTP